MLPNCSRRVFSAQKISEIPGMAITAAKNLFTELGLIGDGSVALTMGAPGERHLAKVAHFLEQAGEYTRKLPFNSDFSYLQYGPRQGSFRFRQNVAKFLSKSYGDIVKSEDITVTAGGTHGLQLVGSVLFPKGAIVFVEDPTYFLAINILQDELGMQVKAAPTDDNGIIPEELEKLLIENKSTKSLEQTVHHPYSALVYLVPTYNNPRGYCTPEDRCQALVDVARKHDALLFCDDVYNLLHYGKDQNPPHRLLNYDQPDSPGYKGNTLSNGTFSKIMAPGLRLGWIEAGRKITGRLSNNNVMWSAGSANHYTSEIVASALELGLEQEYLKELIQEYKENVKALCTTLHQCLPKNVKFNTPEGGYFVWLEMPPNASAAAVAKICLNKHQLKILQGQLCSATGHYTNCIRVSFSHYPKEILIESATKLCDAINEHLHSLQ